MSSDYLDAVYDLTIAYSNVSESPVPRKPAPSMTGMSNSAIIINLLRLYQSQHHAEGSRNTLLPTRLKCRYPFAKQLLTFCSLDFLVSRGQQVHVYCRRHAAHDIPKVSAFKLCQMLLVNNY